MTVSNPIDRSNFLRWSLRANAGFSTLSGLVFLASSAWVADLLGPDVPAGLVASVGAQLLVFAVALVWLASRPTLPVSLAIGVIVADLLWVLATIVVVQGAYLSARGEEFAIVLADVVLLMAILQSVGVHRLRKRMRLPTTGSVTRPG